MLNALVAACAQTEGFTQRDVARKLVEKFRTLAQTLDRSKAVAFTFGDKEDREIVASPIQEQVLASGDSSPGSQSSPLELSTSMSVQEDILHPLLVALLAFKLGGPINAAFTGHQHEWRPPTDTARDTPSFYSEGDVGDVFDNIRITVVWEMRDDKATGPSGKHSVFLTGDATPRPLEALTAQKQAEVNSPVTILYDCRHAALYYVCDDPDVIRKSMSLDVHLNTISDEDVRLLKAETGDESRGKPSLTELVTNFPIESYASHFHDILFDSISINAIFTKLEMLDVPPAPALPPDRQNLQDKRFDAYKKDNLAHLPIDIKRLASDVCLGGSYPTAASFLDKVALKARRDVHLPLGASLFPQSLMEEDMEWARKSIRDLHEELVSNRVAHYATALVDSAYATRDLISTANLRNYAKMLERHYLELIGIGFTDDACSLPAMAALACAFGNAIDGLKEVHIMAEPWIEEMDLQVYRTRCLYLFWCADWLVYYLAKPEPGPFMIIDEKTAIAGAQGMGRAVRRIATMLLRNWVAWSLLVEGLPQGGFFVRRS
ncbi:hypothetical protein J4E93_002106 [Alternaria ventricosa]|uniref:uncharacterized protein n=1 Tax=Alternaria ventricosa TaxID=1187951 RepID=UPI0020C284A9|nr:uncharacterized protein J4E93_002106 [Alternaria ventricosa]KAI4651910.1 hypothetical protein J4E93_002106 [Alternaria ventricosa]